MIQIKQAELAADSAIRLALFQLSTSPPQGASTDLGSNSSDLGVTLTVERESSRIDLNAAKPEIIMALFAANGTRESDARDYVARIVDWRDSNEQPEEGGAESSAYRAAGRKYGPRNGPFQSVEELHRVLGLEALSDSLLNAFTVYTQSNAVSFSHARPAVRNALKWADSKQLGGHRWLSGDESNTGIQERSYLVGQPVRVTACQRKDLNVSVCREVVAQLTGNRRQLFHVFVWRTKFVSVT